MKTNELRVLLSTEDRIVAENIQSILEEHDIYTMLVSDNPASSVIGIYMGSSAMEMIDIQINNEDYQRAVEILNENTELGLDLGSEQNKKIE
jgi:hypothetical protein